MLQPAPFLSAANPIASRAFRRARSFARATQGLDVRPILVDRCAYLLGPADRPVAGDEDIDVARHALEQPQRGE
jgi:hypothetical protein